MGSNDHGQRALPVDDSGVVRDSTVLRALDTKLLTSVASGPNNLFAIDHTGVCYAWGHGRSGALGREADECHVPMPLQGLGRKRITALSCGEAHVISIATCK